MKKFFICISMLFCLSTFAYAGNDVPMNYQPYGSTHGGSPKSPINIWYVNQDGNVMSMHSTPCDYTLTLYDEENNLVYTTFVPAGTIQVVLPSTLSGDYELRFETDTYYYYGFIDL